MNLQPFVEALPIERRLALSYGTGRGRVLMLGLMALDQRLGQLVRQTREPMLAQIKLAWWREQLDRSAAERAGGEPLLALLEHWGEAAGELGALAAGWEALLGDAPDFQAFAAARGDTCEALAHALGQSEAAPMAKKAGTAWALAELATKVSVPQEHEAVLGAIAQAQWGAVRLPVGLRPLAVLHGLARRAGGKREFLDGFGAGLLAARLGLLGI